MKKRLLLVLVDLALWLAAVQIAHDDRLHQLHGWGLKLLDG